MEIDELKARFRGSRWDPVRREWNIPVRHYFNVLEFADDHGFEIDPEAAHLDIPRPPRSTPELSLFEDKILVQAPYEEVLQKTLDALDGSWHTGQMGWVFPHERMTKMLHWAKMFDADVSSEVTELAAALEEKELGKRAQSHSTEGTLRVPGIGLELYPYQRAGVEYASEKRRTFIADPMGVGKTIQALATVHHLKTYPALVVCQPSLLLDWEAKINEGVPEAGVHVIRGRAEDAVGEPIADGSAHYTVVGYSNLEAHAKALSQGGFRGLILDESHYCKNPKAKRTKAAMKVADSIPEDGSILLLTGTPIMNRPAEYAPQLEILGMMNEFGTTWEFYRRYCNAHRDRFGQWDLKGASRLPELHTKLRSLGYIRREVKDVLPDLPEITHDTILIEMPLKYRSEYMKAVIDIEEWYTAEVEKLAEVEGRSPTAARIKAHFATQHFEELIQLTALRRITAQAKVKPAVEWALAAVDAGEKVVIAAHHREIVNAVADATGGLKIIGGQSPEETERVKQEFSDGELGCLTISIQAAAHGHTLTAARQMLVVEPPWTPALYEQTIKRIHRIGQEHPVVIHNMVCPGTVDERVHNTLRRKLDATTAAITNDLDVSSLLQELIQGDEDEAF